jgi:hypothetical protein
MRQETRISVKAEQYHTDTQGEPRRFYCGFPGADYFSDWTEAKARRKAQEGAQDALLDAAWFAGVGKDHRVMSSADGTVILVLSRFRDSFEYEMHHAGQRGVSSCASGGDYSATVRAARKHAAQAFGGIVWETGSHVEGEAS